ncbi:MAG: IS1634 family transposase, partial [Burkholderiales bacterium]
MFLRATTRKKDGKEHRYFSVVENRRVSGGRVLQRHVLYLGEINSSQELAWRRSIEVVDEATRAARTLALFPEDRCEGVGADASIVRLKLAQLRLERPRQWGACRLTLQLRQSLGLDEFWRERLTPSRKGTRFDQVLLVLVAYRLVSPGSEWRLHRHWFERSALGDLLGADAALADIHTLYACHDRLLEHKEAVFDHLVNRWRDLFNATFDVLLYDLTSTYFESDPPADDEDKRRHGYSRDHRPDCVQVVMALVVTPEGFPLAYEVLAGNTADSSTLKGFLERIERQYGQARRVWCMDRGVPTEDVLAQMRGSDPPVPYLVGTPKGRLTRLEPALLEQPWHPARPGVQVKLLAQDGELYV